MKKHILLIEDDTYTRELYKDLLIDEGFAVTAVDDGEKGLTAAVNGGFNLILLDIMLPKMDGLEFMTEYTSLQPNLDNGPLLMLTALDDDRIIKGCLALGAAGYLMKTALTPADIVREVNAYIK